MEIHRPFVIFHPNSRCCVTSISSIILARRGTEAEDGRRISLFLPARMFIPLNFVRRSSTTTRVSSSPRKERKGKARRGEAEITRPPGTGRVMDRGAKKRTPLLLSSSVSFSVYEMVARRRDRSRRAPERRDAACTNRSCVRTSTPALKPPFYRLYFSSDPTPLVRKGLHSSLLPLSPLSSRFFYSPLGVIKVSIRSIRKIRFFTPHACRVRFVSF